MPNLYELLRLEVQAGDDLPDSDPEMLNKAFICNLAVKDFLRGKLLWDDLMDILKLYGVNVDEYQQIVLDNFREAGIVLL
jgi:hypothetical protein